MAPRRSILILATLAIWSVAWVVWTADVLVEPVPFALERAARRLPLCIAGAALCLALAAGLARIPSRRLALPAAGLGIVACSFAFALLNEVIFYVAVPRWGPSAPIHILDVAMMDGWVFLAWTLLFFALASDAARRDRELALARSEAATRDAQHRLLASQAQPHFLFNALNSIYALLLDEDADRAGRALLTLSDYLRQSLEEPGRMVTLSEELRLVRDYLAIEQLRFGDRLQVRVAVPNELLSMKLPPLLLQPLVENSVRHGLPSSLESMTIGITAERDQTAIAIVVEDNGSSTGNLGGAAIGLASVRQRLQASFGVVARVTAGERPSGGWRVELRVPT